MSVISSSPLQDGLILFTASKTLSLNMYNPTRAQSLMYSFGFSTNRSATPSSLKATTPYLLGSRAGAPRSLMSPLPPPRRVVGGGCFCLLLGFGVFF